MIDPKLIDRENWEEHYVKQGDPSKPTYYIIRRKGVWPGLFATFSLVAGAVKYAITKGWIPVVDMQNYPSAYLPPEKLGKENAWEYYFEQPMGIGLEEAQNGDNIILSNEFKMPIPWRMIFHWGSRKDILAEWKILVTRGFLKIKPEITEEVLAIRDKLFPPKERILGVHLRGTDYLTRPHGHMIPPPTEYALKVVIERMREWKCDKLFLATEDINILKIFQESFGNYLLTFDKPYKDYKPGKTVGYTRIERENDYFLSGKDYLIEMLLLSKCNSFIASGGAGNNCAMFFGENFDNVHVFDFGCYGIYPKYKP